MVKRKRNKGQTTQWSKEKGQKDRQHNGQKKKDKRTDNIMVKRKRTKGQTTQWSKEKGQKDRQHNGQKKKDKGQTTIIKTLLRKQKIDLHEHHYFGFWVIPLSLIRYCIRLAQNTTQ
jgi:hypothetical protein